MDNRLKAGIISGLIAGIVLGIAYEIFNQIIVSLGFYEPWFQSICTNNIIINIPLYAFWGIIFGIIFSKAYIVIPKKAIWKGLIYGLFLWLIISIRIQTFNLVYGRVLQVVSSVPIDFLMFLIFGLVLGILYNKLLFNGRYPAKEKLQIKTYDMKSGIIPGAIAGIADGITSSIVVILGPVIGLWGFFEGPVTLSFDLWLGQLGSHIHVNMIWGAIFGAFFAKVYNLIPGKEIKKGLYYGLIMYLMTSFYIGIYCVCWSIYHNVWYLAISMFGQCIVTGFFGIIAFGLVLGLLYKKPPK